MRRELWSDNKEKANRVGITFIVSLVLFLLSITCLELPSSITTILTAFFCVWIVLSIVGLGVLSESRLDRWQRPASDCLKLIRKELAKRKPTPDTLEGITLPDALQPYTDIRGEVTFEVADNESRGNDTCGWELRNSDGDYFFSGAWSISPSQLDVIDHVNELLPVLKGLITSNLWHLSWFLDDFHPDWVRRPSSFEVSMGKGDQQLVVRLDALDLPQQCEALARKVAKVQSKRKLEVSEREGIYTQRQAAVQSPATQRSLSHYDDQIETPERGLSLVGGDEEVVEVSA